jgi:acetolactate synthase-1/2/3 large subunit
VHAADAYSRSSQKVGVALVTSGPGVTNTVTGIATAYMDSIPMVVITGQVPTLHRPGCLPGVRHGWHYPPLRQAQFPGQGRQGSGVDHQEGLPHCGTGRPGPVVVDIPKDITAQMCEFEYPKTIQMRSYNPVVKGHLGQIKKAVQILQEAKRPIIYTGGGVILSTLPKS